MNKCSKFLPADLVKYQTMTADPSIHTLHDLLNKNFFQQVKKKSQDRK
jgi:hypothetical protein